MTTIHMIANAHLDPVWLWRWQTGVTAALATCRSVVEQLDNYPEFVFTRSDVWFHQQIERHDKALFRRVQDYVAEGRWRIVGGMYIQPDCNLPLGDSFQRHLAVSDRYVRDKFGVSVNVGYNPDGFGHAGTLPGILNRHGFDSYVMMRPMEHEKSLPGPLFRWRGDDGAELMTWRVQLRYNCSTVAQLIENVDEVLRQPRPDGVCDVMSFFGAGDHGGGPTRDLIEWVSGNPDHFPDCRMVFSDPRSFFDAVAPSVALLPVVEGELQYHAVGCYSVLHDVKTTMRRAEYRALQAEEALKLLPEELHGDNQAKLDSAWEHILFNQFHDTLGGSSLPEAYDDCRDQLGHALAQTTEVINDAAIHRLHALPPASLQRIVAYNFARTDFAGLIEHEPWLEWDTFSGLLLDSNERPVEYQLAHAFSTPALNKTIIFPATIPPGGETLFFLDPDAAPHRIESPCALSIGSDAIANAQWSVSTKLESGLLCTAARQNPNAEHEDLRLSIDIHDDASDSWSHGIEGYSWEDSNVFRTEAVTVVERGPLRASIRMDARCRNSTASAWFRLCRDIRGLELILQLDWHEPLAVAKLVIQLPGSVVRRLDGVPGGVQQRQQDRREYPLVNFTALTGADGMGIGIVAPDSFGIDGDDSVVRCTLCRSPAYAWEGHKTAISANDAYRWTDQGVHHYRFIILDTDSVGQLSVRTEQLCNPPTTLDWTLGMGAEHGE
jgi:alpha-mannosidase